MTCSDGSYPFGAATTTSIPTCAAATTSECATLFPSPMYASFNPLKCPFTSLIVSRSASAWQGCEISVKPLITGIDACSANSFTIACEFARIIIPSTYPDNTCAVS